MSMYEDSNYTVLITVPNSSWWWNYEHPWVAIAITLTVIGTGSMMSCNVSVNHGDPYKLAAYDQPVIE